MNNTWFSKVIDELSALGVFRNMFTKRVKAAIRECWLENLTPEETAKKVKSNYYP